MSHSRRLLLSASYFQTISSTSRHQLRVRRRPVQFSSASRIYDSSRTFTSQTRLRQDKADESKNDDGAATLPEETSTIARAADEPPKPSDLEEAATQTPKKDDGAATLPEETSTIARTADEPAKPADVKETPIELSKEKDDGAATLPEETSTIARAADEPPKPADVEPIPGDASPVDLAEATGATNTQETSGEDALEIEAEEVEIAAAQPGELDVDTATILQHGESEAHRDLREYARLAAWELPLLNKLRKPFEPPTSSTPLRFRYTSYMGDEHPASKKVVVEFKPADLPGLNEKQQIKLIKLAGTRYNPEKQMIKMSCESFEIPAQNKRYLGDLVQKLVKEAKDSKDTFEDIPVDLRHHKLKPSYKFPEEWKIQRPARIESGEGLRGKGNERRKKVREMQELGQVVDGAKVIQDAMAAMPLRLAKPVPGQKTILNARSGKAPVRRA